MSRYDEVLARLDTAIETMHNCGAIGPKVQQYHRMRERLATASPADTATIDSAERMLNSSRDMSESIRRLIDRVTRRPERGRW
jgi:hypothetical protein